MVWLEVTGTAFALLGVFLTTRQKIWCWPVSIIAIIIYIYIFFKSKLYGDSGLQFIYLFLSFYGWYEWLYGGKGNEELKVNKTSYFLLSLFIIIGFAGTAGLGWLLENKTDSDVPYWDALTTAFSLVATFMMARKLVENWIFWIVIDIIYTGIYVFKGLNVTAFQYLIFTLLALYGYLQWRRTIAIVNV
jgi:nicotinamide mononucleotide transporter